MHARRTKRNKRPLGPRCPVCRGPIVQPKRGRRRSYCSNACRQAAHRRRRDGAHRRGLVRLVEGDGRELLRSLPDESVDLIVTDPPYRFERGATHFRDWFEELPDSAWPGVFRQLERVLGPDAHLYVFCDDRVKAIFDAAAATAGFRVRTPLIWDKGWIGLGGTWRPQYEYIAFYEKGSRPGNFRNRSNVLRASRVVRGYPTEKPVEILKELISQASDPGELVLDPFCGSGNVGAAARQLGRRALLCDVDAGFAARRLRLKFVPVEQAIPLRNRPGKEAA
jgi:site-specific DNA-methyltransferase (adenine-specific)